MSRYLHATLAALPLLAIACRQPGTTPDRLASTDQTQRVTFRDTFDQDQVAPVWSFRTPDLWSLRRDGKERFLQMAEPPKRPMMPGIRRPQEFALYEPYEFRSFSLSCWLRIDRDPSVKGRDACIIFGRRDDTHFYYAHLSNESNGYHNGLIRVDGDSRRTLQPDNPYPPPAIMDADWHKVDILRDVDAGTIKVYVDEQEPPVFDVIDDTYDWGKVAIGSFDDHASFAGILIGGDARPAGRTMPDPAP